MMSLSSRFISAAAALALLPAAIAYDRSEHLYAIPKVTLTDQAGRAVRLDELLNLREPVVLQFIFTTCTTICPILSATLHTASKELKGARLVSITIDPEHDTPARLAAYADQIGASSRWTFLTGSAEDIAAVQRAFDADVATKMSHLPLTLLRGHAARSWVRLDGLSTAAELVAEYRRATR
jgi:protein SCO1/2